VRPGCNGTPPRRRRGLRPAPPRGAPSPRQKGRSGPGCPRTVSHRYRGIAWMPYSSMRITSRGTSASWLPLAADQRLRSRCAFSSQDGTGGFHAGPRRANEDVNSHVGERGGGESTWRGGGMHRKLLPVCRSTDRDPGNLLPDRSLRNSAIKCEASLVPKVSSTSGPAAGRLGPLQVQAEQALQRIAGRSLWFSFNPTKQGIPQELG
jgi:hypothetical protein